MSKKNTLIFMLFCLPKLMAQQAAIASGGNATGANGTSSYTIGQVAYLSATGANGTINQGVQQPFEIFTLGNDHYPEIALILMVYPNPTTSLVNLRIENHSLENLNYQLVDMNGRQIQSKKIDASETQITMENIASAIYLLNVMENNKLLKTFKIIKN